LKIFSGTANTALNASSEYSIGINEKPCSKIDCSDENAPDMMNRKGMRQQSDKNISIEYANIPNPTSAFDIFLIGIDVYSPFSE
jgi:hypothetical protein